MSKINLLSSQNTNNKFTESTKDSSKQFYQATNVNLVHSQSSVNFQKSLSNNKKIFNLSTKNIIPIPDNDKTFLNKKPDIPNQIIFLKNNYDKRINQLLSIFQNCVNQITSSNAEDLINKNIFIEKEKIIADLYEQNSIIKTEYEENKIEIDRLQKVISVLEIDIHKYEKKIKEKNNEINILNNNNSELQEKNFNLNLQIKNLIDEQNKNFSNNNQQILLEKTIEQLKNEINNNKINYEENLNKLNNNFINEINNLKNNNEKIENNYKIIQSNLNNYINDNLLLTNKIKTKDQIIILLKSKINGIKSDINSFQKFVIELIKNFSKEKKIFFENIINKIKISEKTFKDKIKNIENQNEKKFNEKNTIINNYKNENLKLLNENNILNDKIKFLNKKIKENEKNLISNNNIINKLKMDKEVLMLQLSLNNNKNIVKIDNSTNTNNNFFSFNNNNNDNNLNKEKINDFKIILIEKLKKLQLKYLKEINKLKSQIKNLSTDFKNYINKKEIIINKLNNKLYEFKDKNDKFKIIIKQKDKKIKEIQDSINKSYLNFSNGKETIKIANLLDNEVKEIFTKDNQ